MSEELTPGSTDESCRRSNCLRRSVLKATGASAALPVIGGVVTAGDRSRSGARGRRTDADGGHHVDADAAQSATIHPQFGYSGTSDDDVPGRFSPAETVELHVDEDRIDEPSAENPDLTVEFGAFHFDPVGLHVEPGSVVEFRFESPEHSVTAFHRDQDRQQRVPDGVQAFSSPVNEHRGFWLYRFDTEGVYDLFCGPHEYGGMGMRIVVGENPGRVVREQGRPPLPLTGALLGSGLPPDDPDVGHRKLAPQYIVENGPISIGNAPESDELTLDLAVTVTGPAPP